jgi:hypothetical protein
MVRTGVNGSVGTLAAGGNRGGLIHRVEHGIDTTTRSVGEGGGRHGAC